MGDLEFLNLVSRKPVWSFLHGPFRWNLMQGFAFPPDCIRRYKMNRCSGTNTKGWNTLAISTAHEYGHRGEQSGSLENGFCRIAQDAAFSLNGAR